MSHTATMFPRGVCSCGESATHILAKRRTADEKTVILWSDGMLTRAMGFGIPGIGRAKSTYARNRDIKIGWLVLEIVSLYTTLEVTALVVAARRAHAQPGSTEDWIRSEMRRALAGKDE